MTDQNELGVTHCPYCALHFIYLASLGWVCPKCGRKPA